MKTLLKNIHTQIDNMLMEMKSDITIAKIKSSRDKELVFDHSLCHSYWSRIVKNESVQGWNKNKLIRIHAAIVSEMLKRGFKHTHKSSLDDTLPKNLKDKTIKS